ncbi:ATP-binding protein [Idiomarina sp.]|uniref:ATP-binding protein n=2 Tax=Idiomarina sp. TaxID=1874361 RepID=UPI003559E3B7
MPRVDVNCPLAHRPWRKMHAMINGFGEGVTRNDMAGNAARLKKIIMINGHLPGIVELDLEGHTNICGSNASGKTTLQRMIPVFYGEQPNKVVPKTRDNFDKFYLPYSNSYIIYSYRSAAQRDVQVVLTKRSDGVDYRFIDADYCPQDYLDQQADKVIAVEYAEWLKRLRAKDCLFSHKISATSEFRTLIQNDVQALQHTQKDSVKLRQLAARFALVKAPHKLRHIEKLVSAVHAKEGKMDTLRSMLAAILEEDGHAVPHSSIRGEKIRRWIDQMRQNMRLEELQAAFSELSSSAHRYGDELAELWAIQPLMSQHREQLADQERDLKATLRTIEQRISQRTADYEQQRDQVNETLSEHKAELKQVERQLDEAQSKADAFRDANIEEWEHKIERLPALREQADEVKQQRIVLLEAHQSERQQLDSEKLKLTERQQRRDGKHQAKLDGLATELAELHASHSEVLAALREQHQLRRNEQTERWRDEREAVKLKLAALHSEQSHNANAEEQQQLDAMVERVADAQEQLTLQRDQLEHAREQLNLAQRNRLRVSEELNREREQLASVKIAIKQKSIELEPEPDSLRGFLHSQAPQWHETIGKVISPALLERTDLNPVLGQDNTSVFGLQLDLAAIEATYHDDTEGRAELERLQKQQQSLIKCVDETEQQLARETEHVTDAEAQLRLVQQQLHKQQRELEYALDAQARLKAAIKRQISERTEQLSAQKATLEERLESLNEHIEFSAQELIEQQRSAEIELKAEQQDAVAQLHESQDFERQQQAEERAQLKDDIKALERAFSDKLAQQGVNEHDINQLKQREEQLNEAIQQALERQELVREYRHFKESVWQSARPQWQQREQQLQSEILALEDKKRLAKDAFEQSKAQDVEQRQRTQLTLEQSTTLLQRLRESVNKLEHIPTLTPELQQSRQQGSLEHSDSSELIGRCDDVYQRFLHSDKVLNEQLRQFDNQLRRDAQTDFLNFMEESRERMNVGDDIASNLALYQAMLNYLEEHQQAILATGHNISKDLVDFFTVFNDIHKRVAQYSRRLTDAVGNELSLSGIDRAEVKISSTIDALGFWEPLKQFVASYERWQASGERLPHEDYLLQLGMVADILRADQKYSIESLLKIELFLTESGNELVIRNDRQLAESSSHGMAYLILCKFLLAFTRLLRSDAEAIILHWPIDEIGTLAYHNVEKLFDACDSNQIQIVGAFPNPESDVLMLFKHRYLIEAHPDRVGKGQLKRIQPKASGLSEKLAHLVQQEYSA